MLRGGAYDGGYVGSTALMHTGGTLVKHISSAQHTVKGPNRPWNPVPPGNVFMMMGGGCGGTDVSWYLP